MVGSPGLFLAAYLPAEFLFLANFVFQGQRQKREIHVIDFNFKQLVFSLLQQCPCSIGEVQPRFMFRVCTARARFLTVTKEPEGRGRKRDRKKSRRCDITARAAKRFFSSRVSSIPAASNLVSGT